jgi:hypothetical protein
MILSATMIKPIIRIVHGNPYRGKHCCTITGNSTPPVQLPIAVHPNAKALLFTKYVLTSAIAGQNCSPFAIPKHSACDKNICHSFVLSARVKIPMIWNTAPAM